MEWIHYIVLTIHIFKASPIADSENNLWNRDFILQSPLHAFSDEFVYTFVKSTSDYPHVLVQEEHFVMLSCT